MFEPDERLALCASFVREGAAVADIGTDHAYLPVWLVRSGKIPSAIAADLREGPLANAQANIERNGVSDRIKTVLSDGLDNIDENEADDIVIAGMGGELIAGIIGRALWLRDPCKHLILQPMTKADYLRRYLCENGFAVKEERACISLGKSYCVMLCEYDGKNRECSDETAYIGLLGNDGSYEAKRYIHMIREKLMKKIKGFGSDTPEYCTLAGLIEKFGKMSEGAENNDKCRNDI